MATAKQLHDDSKMAEALKKELEAFRTIMQQNGLIRMRFAGW